ncbi:MAG: replicative DNA helicase, partial [Gammaproteobacteria bacterium]|nr:replicative DNA helicase [Gammaproteobacteria bacterium]
MAGAVSSVEAKVTEQLRVPPHSVEAEQAVLGGLMLDNTAWDKVADRITEEDFYRHDHRLVFRALKTLAENGKPLDAVTVGEWLESNALLEETGGLVYLGKLAKDTPSAANARAYADIVRERSILRQLIRIGGEISDAALNTEGKSSIDLVEKAEQLVFRIAEHGSRAGQGFQGMKTLLTKAVDRLDTLFHSQSNITGIASGYADFDNLTAGLQRSDLIIIAGRPSM